MSVPNVYLSENGQAYDASILIDKDGTIKGVQKMVHVAQAEKFYEQDYYTPSDTGFSVWETECGKIGIQNKNLPKCLNGNYAYRHSKTA